MFIIQSLAVLRPWNPFTFVQLVYMVQIQIACLAAVLAWLLNINVTSHFLSSTILNYAKKHRPQLDAGPSIFRQQMFLGQLIKKQISSTCDDLQSQNYNIGHVQKCNYHCL